MKNIFFVNSLNKNEKKHHIPLGILSLATILKNKSYNVKIIDLDYLYLKKSIEIGQTYDEDIENISSYILDRSPDVVDFYTMCNSYHTSIMIAKKLKERNPSIKIMFGGPQASLTAEKSMLAFPWIDVIGIGEGENTIEDIVDALCTDKGFDNIKGVAYRKEGEIICNSELNLIADLDELPFIDYSLINMEDINAVPLDVGRGCPFGCTYCSTKTFWKRAFRLKSSQRILSEIKYMIDNYNIKNFDFVHDLFTANKVKVIEVCDLVIEENLKIKWGCSARIDTLDEEVISKMAQAGCYAIFLGIETGSQRMQKLINKNLKLHKVYEVIDILKKYNIEVTASFIYGFPNETFQDIEDTLNLINNLNGRNVNHLQLHLLSVLPGTELLSIVKDELELCSNISDICQSDTVSGYMDTMISKNPEIFPQFFEFHSSVRNSLSYLDKFIYYFYPLLYKHMKSTFGLLMEHYAGSLLKLFMEFKDRNTELLSELISINIFSPKSDPFEKVHLIDNYINSADFGNKTKLIREVSKFEINILNFMYIQNDSERVLDYDFDVYALKKKGINIEADVLYPVKIKFTRIEKDHINIKRIA